MSSELPIHTPRPRKDPRRWLMQVDDYHAIFYRDLPREVRAWGVKRLMQMVRAGEFPRYHQIAPGGKRFWAGKAIKAWLAAQSTAPTPEPVGPDNHVPQNGEAAS